MVSHDVCFLIIIYYGLVMAEVTCKQIVIRILIDLFCLFLVFLPWILLKGLAKPFHQGFFCDDESLRHPYKSSTITTPVYVSVSFIVNIGAILITEGVIHLAIPRKQGLLPEKYSIGERHVPMFLVACYKAIGFFLFGAAVVESVTNICKYGVGRLRPHFFDICQPDFSQIKCQDELGHSLYVTQFTCLGSNTEYFKELRLSFPSGHTSFSVYAAIYFSLYLQARLCWKQSKLLKHLLQALAIYAALYTALSRISDYKHHWSDVLCGFFIGAIVAVVVGMWVSDFFKGPYLRRMAEEIAAVLYSSEPDRQSNHQLIVETRNDDSHNLPPENYYYYQPVETQSFEMSPYLMSE